MAMRLSVLLILMWLQTASGSHAAAPSARDMVIQAGDRLVLALQDQREAVQQDMDVAFQLAENTVIPLIDFERITRWVSGRHWRDATPEQQQRLVRAFQELLTRSYVTAMVTYVEQILANSDNVEYPPARSRQDERNAVVTMLIKLENSQTAVVQYQMYLSADGWKIFDVIVEGVSLAITYRSSFNQEVSRGGIEGLIASLDARNQANEPPPLPEVAP
ncbi:MAG: ABC transporter substrate-binding protein [Xanthomonadaceae bacterium]|nr:ABC transporter substrate-binding protein [Xanthomonadaceae bacterium]